MVSEAVKVATSVADERMMRTVGLDLAAALEIGVECVSVKAKTGEMVDAVGQRHAVRAQAVVLLVKSS